MHRQASFEGLTPYCTREWRDVLAGLCFTLAWFSSLSTSSREHVFLDPMGRIGRWLGCKLSPHASCMTELAVRAIHSTPSQPLFPLRLHKQHSLG